MFDGKMVGNAILCVFDGETDCAVAVIVETIDHLKQAIVDNWTGDADCDETHNAMQEISEHDFVDEGDLCFEFEIGRATFSDVFTYTQASQSE